MGEVSNAYSRIHTARARVHGWVGTEKLRRRHVHGDATECVVFIARQRNACCSSGANRLARSNRWKRGLAYRRTEETALCSTGHDRNGILFFGWGLAYHKTEEMDFSWTSYGRNGVLLIGRGVAYRKTEDPHFDRSAPTQVCFVRFAVRHTPPDQQDPLFNRRRSVSSVLRYARPLLMNKIPFRPWPVEHKAVSSILQYARPRFHRLFHPSRLAPDEQHAFRCLPMNTTHFVASP